MKKWIVALLLILSTSLQAAEQCKVDIKNEVRVDGSHVEIIQRDVSKVLIDENNDVYINGEKLDLNQLQREAVASYRQHMNEYLPKAVQIAQDGLALVESALDEVAVSFNNSEAFTNVKQALQSFFNGIKQRYQKDNQFVLKEAAFSDALAGWKDDLAEAKKTFNAEFFSSAFTALSEQMKGEGGVNLTALKEKLVQLQASIETRFESDAKKLEQEAQQYCDDLEKVAEEEKMLHETIPELKDYQVFLI